MDKITNTALSDILQGLTGAEFLSRLINVLIEVALIGGAVIFLFMLLWGGIGWMTSGGDKTATEAARGRVTSAVIGLALLLFAFAIIKLIGSLFGINLLGDIPIPTITQP